MTSVKGSNAAGQVERLLDIVAARDGSDDATLVVAWPAPVAPVDPFGLHRLLERPQSRRRPLLAGVVAVGAGVAAMGVAGAWLAPRVAETLLPPNRPPPGPLAAEYLRRWQDGDLGALYERLTPAAQAALDRDTFIRRHQAFGAELTLTGLNLTPGATPVAGTQPGASAGVAFDAVYTTARFGELRRQNTLPLEWRDGRWGVSWTPAVLLPELSAGRTVRAFSDPAARGAILERQGRPLAVTSAESATSGTRQYPQGTVAGPLTGYVGEVTAAELAGRAKDGILAGDRVGKAGLEGAADALLAGQRGGRLTILTPNGEIATTLSSVPPRAGETVRLTLDLDLQRELEAALDGRAGSIVVLNPQDGSIRALATYPRYDPNAFTSGGDVSAILNDSGQPLINRPMQGLYPPGSIFKAVTMAAGLEQGAFRPDSEFTCSGRWTGLPGLSFDCWLRTGHGRLDLVSGLEQSCNSVFYEVGKRLDEIEANYLPSFAAQCGFGGASGALPGQEPAGVVPSPAWKRQALNDGWARGDAVNMAIGQGQLLVTPLQVAALYSAIAAGGQRHGPQLLERAFLPGGNVERLLSPAAKPPLPWSAPTLDTVRTGLKNVVGGANGTAAAIFQGSSLAGVTAGKTGTAETGPGRQPHAWFACYAPVEAPKAVVLAMLEHAGEGSQVAAPLARRVLEIALR